MRTILFAYGSDKIIVYIDGNTIKFGSTSFGPVVADISGLRLSKKGVEKEFPDLRGDPLWRDKAIKRFKEKIKNYRTEEEKSKYIITDLKKFGYKPEQMQIEGYRPVKIR